MASEYSVPFEATKLFHKILETPSLQLPPEVNQYAQLIKLEGTDFPNIPIPWRLAESISSLKAFEASMLNVLLVRKYGQRASEIRINTDHASLFFMSIILTKIIDGDLKGVNNSIGYMTKVVPARDPYRSQATLYRQAATSIYRTKDNRFYHVHGSMNPEPTLTALGLPADKDFSTFEEAAGFIGKRVAEFTAEELDTLMNDQYRQAGTICWDKDEYKATGQGKASANSSLYELNYYPNQKQLASWWKSSLQTSMERPLAGLKVVDSTRVIAGPAISRGLAELGASVMRIVGPQIPDMTVLHLDLHWGKWSADCDLKTEEGRKQLRDLIMEADVFVDGYRPGVMAKYGFGKEDILRMCAERERGIIYVREDCYGWHGPWQGRSGWQQISDACCGVSLEFGRAMGNEEAVTPVFPNADYCTGVCGTAGVLNALIKQAETGGSYSVDCALNYYSQWLVNTCGTYPPSLWQKLWTSHGKPTFRHWENMLVSIPRMMGILHQYNEKTLFNPVFFEERETKAMGRLIRTVKPVLRFPNGEVRPGYQVGARGNDFDKPRWPEDLMIEIVE
ncbi:MAG: hypothetical protein M1834_009387 [Cirrosporium novae-zelandiae]|nr:MAG: hypothetical protein M1834_009387 [Cirrosporium novae-zelandiae]